MAKDPFMTGGELAAEDLRAEIRAEAYQQTDALTIEAIQRDPWNAVALPLPAEADRALLETAAGAVSVFGEVVFDSQNGDSPEDTARRHVEAGQIAERAAMIKDRLAALSLEPATLDSINRADALLPPSIAAEIAAQNDPENTRLVTRSY